MKTTTCRERRPRRSVKRIVSVILSICMLLSLTAGLDFSAYALDESGSCGENVTYTFDSEAGILEISGTGEMKDYSSASTSPFYNQSSIKKVVINSGVTSIGSYAFYGCTGLTSITIPDSVTSIGNRAFSYCFGLTSIIVDSNNKYYDSRNNCNAIIVTSANEMVLGCKNTIVPNTVTSIGYRAFEGCTGLTSIIIPDSVISIGNYAFNGCTGLKELTMPCSAKINNSMYAFYNCKNIEKVTLTKGTGTMRNYCRQGESNSSTDTLINYTPWYISRNNLKELILEEGITNIGNCVFNYCYKLTSITIPNSVISIGDYAFYNCTGLTGITIPDSVTNIGNYAFSGCTGLKEIYMPCSAHFDYYTFEDCTNIEKVTLTKGTGVMQNYTPYDAEGYYLNTPWYISRYNLKELILEEGITNISNYAFYDCEGITSVRIPDSVSSIGESAFYNCSGLTNITIPDSVTNIDKETFSGCTSLSSITIPDSVTEIGEGAFSDCTGLISIKLGKNVSNIGNSAFKGCTGLTKLPIPESVTNIGASAFSNCKSLTSLYIPKKVTTIGDSAFYGCSGVKSLTVSDSVTSIGSNAFSRCSNLKELVIPVSAKINKGAFTGCQNINKIVLSKGNGIMQDYSVSENSVNTYYKETPWFISGNALKSLVIAEGVKSIGEVAFRDSLLASVSIPKTINEISLSAFYNCKKLKTVNYSGSKSDWGKITIGELNESLKDLNINYNTKADEEIHIFVPVNYKAPTCTTDGKGTQSRCSICGTIKNESYVLKATGHKPVVDKAVPATYTSEGKTEGRHCAVCGKILVAQKPVAKLSKKLNTLTVKAKKSKVKFAKLEKKNQKIALKKAITVSNAQGTVAFKISSAKKGNKNFKKYFKVAKNGKITVKKGLKKGTYKIKIKVTASGNTEYKAAAKTVTVTIKVK